MTQVKQRLPISEAAQILDVSIDTLRRWDKSGVIRASRSPRGHRLFDLDEITRVIAKQQSRSTGQGERSFTIYRDDNRHGLRAIDLFAGGGGTALGLDHAGFDHILLAELDPHASATLRTNRPDWNVIEGDVANLDFRPYRGEVDLVEGGFPCQAFSYAGHSRGFADTRGTLFFEFARAIQETMPKAFIGENVKGLLRHDRGRTLATMCNTLQAITDENGVGYTFGYRVVRSQYHDVPQKRERLIIMGVRNDIGSTLYFPKERGYIVSLWDAIGDRPQSPGATYPESKRRVLEQVPPGGYWRDLPVEEQQRYLGGSFHLSGGKTGMARRLSWDEPSLTLTCSPAQKQTERCHPEETRPLNIREYARIQTFPDDWEFQGGMGAAYKQIGNAVPVNLGYYLGKCVEAMIDEAAVAANADFIEAAREEEYVQSTM
ncbi:DNA (cytosine-5-)-methyltransferase [Corynebacterium choanae]|uniref:Cytosine-specific methyltransferase n=1 Tax=Corynebacterium choanae TaxID=1862358 RepID=A0A3G6J9I5_9CORY|nr:DNA (cytosine-5-)-methyltransferase [Corynebacterium choanae]AZA14656.1 Modification methylase HhaI [Corynebacterium choanae]